MGAVKTLFTSHEMDKEEQDARLVKAVYGCVVNEMPDTPESELIRMEVEADLKLLERGGKNG